MSETRVLDLAELDQYFVMGVDKDGKHVTAQSSNLTIQDMAAMLARAQVAVHLQTVMTAMMKVRLDEAPGQVADSHIWTPDARRKN